MEARVALTAAETLGAAELGSSALHLCTVCFGCHHTPEEVSNRQLDVQWAQRRGWGLSPGAFQQEAVTQETQQRRQKQQLAGGQRGPKSPAEAELPTGHSGLFTAFTSFFEIGEYILKMSLSKLLNSNLHFSSIKRGHIPTEC